MNVRATVRSVLLLGLGLTAGGCYAVGAVMHVAFGPPAVDAVYTPQKQSTLVLVENYQDQDAGSVDGDTVARLLGEKLHAHAELDVVDPEKVVPLRTEQAAAFREMKIPEIGKAVGAKQVVYINLIESQSTPDPTGATVHATATARIRIVDVDKGTVLWPQGQPKGYEITARMPFDRTDSAQGAAMRGEMLDQLSDRIAKLFYKWKPETENESNGGSGGNVGT